MVRNITVRNRNRLMERIDAAIEDLDINRSDFIREAINRELGEITEGGSTISEQSLDERISDIKERAREQALEEFEENNETFRPPEHYQEKIDELTDKVSDYDSKIKRAKSDRDDFSDKLKEDFEVDELQNTVQDKQDEVNELMDERDRLAGLIESLKDLRGEAKANKKEIENKAKVIAKEIAEEELLTPLLEDLDARLHSTATLLQQLRTLDNQFEKMFYFTNINHYAASLLDGETRLEIPYGGNTYKTASDLYGHVLGDD